MPVSAPTLYSKSGCLGRLGSTVKPRKSRIVASTSWPHTPVPCPGSTPWPPLPPPLPFPLPLALPVPVPVLPPPALPPPGSSPPRTPAHPEAIKAAAPTTAAATVVTPAARNGAKRRVTIDRSLAQPCPLPSTLILASRLDCARFVTRVVPFPPSSQRCSHDIESIQYRRV